MRALEAGTEQKKEVLEPRHEDAALRQQRLRRLGLSTADIEHGCVVLASPLANTFEDLYGPVRFMHAKHAASLMGNCALCHHARPSDPERKETVACRTCHVAAADPDHPGCVSLKAAYHLSCIGCHQEMHEGPTHCGGCHRRHIPDHQDLVRLPPDPTPEQVTQECLRCHPDVGEDVLESAHWLWRGPSPYTVGRCQEVLCGKGTNAINNFCLGVPSNWPRCTSCHAGYGWKDATFDFSDPTRIDCLVCHDTTGSYFKTPTAAGLPAPQVDLVYVATHVGATSRSTCGECHFSGGGGDAVKHAEMCSALRYPDRTCDVHMGGYDFSCTDCHETFNHKIHGRSSSVPVAEGSLLCEDCHTSRPHYGDTLLDHHLNEHCQTVACNTCHSPLYSKCRPTRIWWDWSVAGDKQRAPRPDRLGVSTYNWMKGEFRWTSTAKPEYAWHNGYSQRVLAGDIVNLDGAVVNPLWPITRKMRGRYIHIIEPVGDRADPSSRITPFKIMRGVQPVDARHRTLLIPHLFPSGPGDTTAYWKTLDWKRALVDGMKAASLPYSGEYKWVRTAMYWRIEHEVLPKELALSCAHCHPALTGPRTCDRCHVPRADVDFQSLAHQGISFAALSRQGYEVKSLIGVTDYLDFRRLGYPGDPILHGGRLKKLPLGQGTMARQTKAKAPTTPPRADNRAGASSTSRRQGGADLEPDDALR
ncbi:MAG: tetrathionate reductase family octaheme c-type cytochrome [Acidobacteria bacterium]|nr:tetrathionate reductase family octaheme c-type cytochrome [Acidobacteriota bacterium]